MSQEYAGPTKLVYGDGIRGLFASSVSTFSLLVILNIHKHFDYYILKEYTRTRYVIMAAAVVRLPFEIISIHTLHNNIYMAMIGVKSISAA